MVACAYCGAFAFGNQATTYKIGPAAAKLAPFAVANAIMADFCQDTINSKYRRCSICASSMLQRAQRSAQLVYHKPEYTRKLLKEPTLQLQLMSLLDVRMNVYKHYNGFVSGRMAPYSLLESPIVSFGNCPIDPMPASDNLKELPFSSNLRTNPIIQRFKCMIEKQGQCANVAVFSSTVVNPILAHHIARGPLQPVEADLLPHALALLSDERPLGGSQAPKRNTIFEMGSLHLRTANRLEERDFDTDSEDAYPLFMRSNGLQRLDTVTSITLETALFPFLFPFGKNAFTGAMGLCNYLRLRMQNRFSIFTLHKLYLLSMYQLRQAVVLSNTFKRSQLERAVFQYKDKFPRASEEEVFKHVLKHDMPGSVPGSPEWHRNQLMDLLAMVEDWGFPSFFLTMTADGISSTRWAEIDDLEKILKRFNKDFTWQDAPVECASLFDARLHAFLRDFVLCNNGLLGKVLHYVIRYEEQGRASLHAKIILWVNERDVARVTNEISASIPAEYDEDSETFVHPLDPDRLALKDLVLNKMHTRHLWCYFGPS
jgi:hypothetical protein